MAPIVAQMRRLVAPSFVPAVSGAAQGYSKAARTGLSAWGGKAVTDRRSTAQLSGLGKAGVGPAEAVQDVVP